MATHHRSRAPRPEGGSGEDRGSRRRPDGRGARPTLARGRPRRADRRPHRAERDRVGEAAGHARRWPARGRAVQRRGGARGPARRDSEVLELSPFWNQPVQPCGVGARDYVREVCWHPKHDAPLIVGLGHDVLSVLEVEVPTSEQHAEATQLLGELHAGNRVGEQPSGSSFSRRARADHGASRGPQPRPRRGGRCVVMTVRSRISSKCVIRCPPRRLASYTAASASA